LECSPIRKSADEYSQTLHDQEAVRIGKGDTQSGLAQNSTKCKMLVKSSPSSTESCGGPGRAKRSADPGQPDIKQWTEEDKAKWNSMSPEQKKAWVANGPNVAAAGAGA
jgi:hypothetical protein